MVFFQAPSFQVALLACLQGRPTCRRSRVPGLQSQPVDLSHGLNPRPALWFLSSVGEGVGPARRTPAAGVAEDIRQTYCHFQPCRQPWLLQLVRVALPVPVETRHLAPTELQRLPHTAAAEGGPLLAAEVVEWRVRGRDRPRVGRVVGLVVLPR